jgi:hypothetical protein
MPVCDECQRQRRERQSSRVARIRAALIGDGMEPVPDHCSVAALLGLKHHMALSASMLSRLNRSTKTGLADPTGGWQPPGRPDPWMAGATDPAYAADPGAAALTAASEAGTAGGVGVKGRAGAGGGSGKAGEGEFGE